AYFARRGRIELEYRVVANRDEIATMGAEELIDRIRTAFAYDEHEWNRERRIAFRGPGRSLGIEALLYLCPRCGRADGIRGARGGRVRCGCGYELRLDAYGEFAPAAAAAPAAGHAAPAAPATPAFRDPGEWHRWEKRALAAALDAAVEAGGSTESISPDSSGLKPVHATGVLVAERRVRLYRRERAKGRVRLRRVMTGDLLLLADRIVFQGGRRREEFPLKDIGGMNVLYRNLFDFAVAEDLYRVKPRAATRSLLKFLHAARHLAARSGSTALGSES
ncbi:MAG TPA: hypothetical protein VMC79_10205, partial [Rectinemataceae bacterium]|nr:hypothetical protein [Rectinemataceae bacterium]